MPKPYPNLLNKIKPEPTEYEIDFFEERAAIIEVMSDVDRPEAERLALEEILKMRESSPVTGRVYISNDISKLLYESKTIKILNPAQDFIDGIQYYGIRLKEVSLIISSDKEIFKIEDSIMRGLTPKLEIVMKSNFTADGIKLFFDEDKVNPAKLFLDIKSYIKRYVHLSNESYYDLFSLYVMATYIFRIFRYFPYIHLYAEKGSGKTTLMSVLYKICFNGTFISNSTPATIFRLVEELSPTLFIDEAEELYKNKSEANRMLIGVLNDGFSKESSIPRNEVVNKSYQVKFFSAYCPKVIASISEFDYVLRDRVIRIKMLRKKDGETVENYIETESVAKEQKRICTLLYFFGLQFAKTIHQKYAKFNFSDDKYSHLSNRNADLWTPLLVIANIIDEYSDASQISICDNIIQLSKEMIADKISDNSIDDVNFRVLSAVKRFVTDNEPLKEENGFRFYLTDDVFNYVISSEEFEGKFEKNNLSQMLSRFKIKVQVVKVDGKSKRAYLINSNKLSEDLGRYEI